MYSNTCSKMPTKKGGGGGEVVWREFRWTGAYYNKVFTFAKCAKVHCQFSPKFIFVKHGSIKVKHGSVPSAISMQVLFTCADKFAAEYFDCCSFGLSECSLPSVSCLGFACHVWAITTFCMCDISLFHVNLLISVLWIRWFLWQLLKFYSAVDTCTCT